MSKIINLFDQWLLSSFNHFLDENCITIKTISNSGNDYELNLVTNNPTYCINVGLFNRINENVKRRQIQLKMTIECDFYVQQNYIDYRDIHFGKTESNYNQDYSVFNGLNEYMKSIN